MLASCQTGPPRLCRPEFLSSLCRNPPLSPFFLRHLPLPTISRPYLLLTLFCRILWSSPCNCCTLSGPGHSTAGHAWGADPGPASPRRLAAAWLPHCSSVPPPCSCPVPPLMVHSSVSLEAWPPFRWKNQPSSVSGERPRRFLPALQECLCCWIVHAAAPAPAQFVSSQQALPQLAGCHVEYDSTLEDPAQRSSHRRGAGGCSMGSGAALLGGRACWRDWAGLQHTGLQLAGFSRDRVLLLHTI